jgi:hypothetical protein
MGSRRRKTPSPFHATVTLDYMPSQFITFRGEYTHRVANVPYFGPPGGTRVQAAP